RFKDTNELTIRNYKPEVKNKLLLLKDDILIEKSGGGEKTPVGRAVIFDKKYEALFANFMERLRTRNNVNPKYFLYILTAFYQNRHMLNYIKQTTGIQNLDISSLLSIERSPFSSISEQQKISAYLDEKCTKIDTIIEKQQKIIEKLKAYKLSLITETVTKGLNPDVKMKDSGVEWIGKIPENWNMIRIKWLLDERKERSEKGIEEPLSMSQKYGLIPTKEMDMIPNVASTYVGAKIVYSNDLVFNKLKAHLGVFSVSRYYGLVSPDYAVYYSTGKAELKYLEYLFKTPQCILEFRKKSSGVADGLTRLYTSGLFSIYCPFPLKSEQQAIANYLDKKCTAIDSAIAKKQALIEKLTEYKKSLIYEVVTGKKEV
ncbi:MAG: restriction endonuclease subunit S, partial [Clostridiales bacterium]|nr:restriction endonuclease subunit S [Clostridiales bacterium]